MTYTIIFLVCFAHTVTTNKNTLRIVGGRNATEEEFPYVVKIMLQNVNNPHTKTFVCSSIVLTSTWTLTAGHCIKRTEQLFLSNYMFQTKVVIDYHRPGNAESSYSEVLAMVPHPRHSFGINDIGLIYTQPVVFTKYGKISSLDYSALIGHNANMVGYGLSDNINIKDPPHLPKVLEVIVKECSEMSHYPEMCFAPPCSSVVRRKSQAICPGDSGGPAIHATGVIAINTMTDPRDCGFYSGERARRDRYDAGYNIGTATPVSPYIDWISNTIKKDAL